jgi:hypothetical protein
MSSQLALRIAAGLQVVAAAAVAMLVLIVLRDVERGRWGFILLAIFLPMSLPLFVWVGRRIVGTPALARGDRAEWLRSLVSWALLAAVGALGWLGLGLAPAWGALAWTAFAMVVLLLLGRP